MRMPMLSASIMCAGIFGLEADLRALERARVEYVHYDVMDDHFVSNLMLSFDQINQIKAATSIPADIHLMAENAERCVERLELGPKDIVTVHAEACAHVQRALALIREKGASAGLALNPGTPLCAAEELLPDLSLLLVMTVNPGYAGQKLIPQTIGKIERARKWLDESGREDVLLSCDGNVSVENAVRMQRAGADLLVVGTSSVFRQREGIEPSVARLRAAMGE